MISKPMTLLTAALLITTLAGNVRAEGEYG